MQNPERWRNIALGFTASGVAAGLALWLLPSTIGNGMQAVLVCYALTAVLFGGVSAAFRHREVRAQRGLARGDEILARWHVDKWVWRDFLTLNAQLHEGPDALPNELDPPAEVPPEGIEITAGKSAINIGGSIHMVPVRGTPEIQRAELNESRIRPSYIELQLKYPGGGTGASGIPRKPTYTVLRFPVAPTALREARVAVAHYNGDTPAAPDFFHGTGDGKDAEDLSVCWNCGFETHKLRSQCPRCGSSLQSRRWSRRFGVVITLAGAFITTVMSVVLFKVWPLLRHPGVDVNGTRFSGGPGAAALVLAVLVAVFALGAGLLGYGVFQVTTGRRNRKVVGFIVAVAVALAILAELL